MGCLQSVPEKPPASHTADKAQNGVNAGHVKDSSAKATADPKPRAKDFGIGDLYEAKLPLGKGGSGETWLCKEAETSKPYAIKFLKRPIPKHAADMVLHEIQVAADLGRAHLNIVRTAKAVLSKSHLAIVMEFAQGGTLTDYVADKWQTIKERNGLYLDEDEACYLFRQFIGAVDVCHKHHVAHRDLKLDNTLLDNSKPPRIKLCDFGFSKNWEGDDCNMSTHIGTPVYMSPQLISSKSAGQGYDGAKADIWASGVLLTVMLLGCFPFEHEKYPNPNSSAAHIEVWLQQIRGSWRDHAHIQELSLLLSDQCRDLLDQILTLDEAARLDISGIKEHPWFNRKLPHHYEAALKELERDQNLLTVRQPSPAELQARDKQLDILVKRATQHAKLEEEVQHVDLL